MIDWLVQPWLDPFMWVAGSVGLMAAITCGVLSCWLVVMGWSLMGDAVAHAVLPGVVIAYAVGAPFAVGAMVCALVAVLLIAVVRDKGHVREDAAIGVVFTALFAGGLILVTLIPSPMDLGHILFGNLLGITNADVLQVVVLGSVVVVVLLVKRQDLTLVAFDPTHARALGLSPRRLSGVVLVSLAATTVVALQAVGVVLAVALLVIPGTTALLCCRTMQHMLWVSPLMAMVGTVCGLYLSYYIDVPTGASIVVVMTVLFAVAYVFSPHRGLLAAWYHRPKVAAV